jgi:hypothetical protein
VIGNIIETNEDIPVAHYPEFVRTCGPATEKGEQGICWRKSTKWQLLCQIIANLNLRYPCKQNRKNKKNKTNDVMMSMSFVLFFCVVFIVLDKNRCVYFSIQIK